MSLLTRCRLCGHASPTLFMDLGDQPFANALHKGDAPTARHPLALAFCHNCSLVQLTHTADPKELFSSYVWVTGTADTTREYAATFARDVLDRAPGAGFVLEAASNDGTFLKEFQAAGPRVLGVDPAENIGDMARRSGIPTKTAFFGEQEARAIVQDNGHADIVIARNVLPHVADPHDFLAGFQIALAPDGLGVIETHHAGIILEELQYDSIYHEHLCYFTAQTFAALAERHGLHAFDVMDSPISGGSKVFFLGKTPRPASAALTGLWAQEAEAGVNDFKAWNRFADLCREHGQHLFALLESARKDNKKVAGYGASARSSTMLNYCGIGVDHIQMIADQNPLKHGLLSPGSNIPIVSPQTMLQGEPDVVIVLAWNFFDEILAILRTKHGYSGEIIKPLPISPVLVPPQRN